MRVSAAALSLAVIVVGLILRQYSVPRYQIHVSNPVGIDRKAVMIAYPPGWQVAEEENTGNHDDGSVTKVRLKRTPSQGPQAWIDANLFHISERESLGAGMEVLLQQVGGFRGLDSEAKRMEAGLSQLRQAGYVYSIRKSRCPSGPLLDVRINSIAQPDRTFDTTLIVYPTAAPRETQYEVIVHSTCSERLKDRMSKLALDVVSRVRLVKVQERPSK